MDRPNAEARLNARHHVFEPGQTFGSWVVVSEIEPARYKCGAVHRMVLLRCSCGVEHVRSAVAIMNGTQSCRKCFLRKNRVKTGDRFGTLVVLDPDVEDFQRREHKYGVLVRCDCGVEKVVIFSDLLFKLRSCGCLRVQRGSESRSWRGYGKVAKNTFNKIRRGAMSRGYGFDLTIEQMSDLFVAQDEKCALSGVALEFGSGPRPITTASLDRIDSSQGYVVGNVQWVHKHVNMMKQDHSDADFVEWCRKVARHHDALPPPSTIEEIR